MDDTAILKCVVKNKGDRTVSISSIESTTLELLSLPANFHYLYSKSSDQLQKLWSPNKSEDIYLTSTQCRSRACLFHQNEFKLKMCKSKNIIRIMRKSLHLQILDKLMYTSKAFTTDCRDLLRFLLLFVQVERASRWWYWEKRKKH